MSPSSVGIVENSIKFLAAFKFLKVHTHTHTHHVKIS